MNTTLILMFAIPLLGAVAAWYLNRKELPWFAGPLFALPGMTLIGIVFACSYGAAVSDTEIWNGQITSKNRVHGTYEQSYECRCHTEYSGSGKDRTSRRVCDTCYETHYTVKWSCQSTVGGIGIDSRDSTWQSVYNTPDPARYSSIAVGDPASRSHTYTNYVQAVPESLFNASPKNLGAKFAGLLPPYPDQVYDLYRIDRFLTPGFAFTDVAAWNNDISLLLRELGPKKQVNLIVVVAKTADASYQYALRDHWEGVNKNDVVLVIGSTDGQHMEFVSVLSWTKNELFKVELADGVRDVKVIDRTKILPLVAAQIAKNFERRHMAEFEYLKGQIDPPAWLIWLTVVLLVAGYGGGALYLNRAAAGTFRGRR